MEIPIGILSPKTEHSSEIAIAGIFGLEAYRALRSEIPKTEHSSEIAIARIFGLEAYRALRFEILPISNNKDIVKLLLDPIVFSNFFHT